MEKTKKLDKNKELIPEIKLVKDIFYRASNHELTNIIEKVKQIPKILECLYFSEVKVQVYYKNLKKFLGENCQVFT